MYECSRSSAPITTSCTRLHASEQKNWPLGRAARLHAPAACKQPMWNSRSHESHNMIVRSPNLPPVRKSGSKHRVHVPTSPEADWAWCITRSTTALKLKSMPVPAATNGSSFGGAVNAAVAAARSAFSRPSCDEWESAIRHATWL
jgi:hypothetical protein